MRPKAALILCRFLVFSFYGVVVLVVLVRSVHILYAYGNEYEKIRVSSGNRDVKGQSASGRAFRTWATPVFRPLRTDARKSFMDV